MTTREARERMAEALHRMHSTAFKYIPTDDATAYLEAKDEVHSILAQAASVDSELIELLHLAYQELNVSQPVRFIEILQLCGSEVN